MNFSSDTSIKALILDLDGTLLDTESATKGVLREFLAKYGKELNAEREGKKRLGATLLVSAASIVEDYDLPLSPDQFINEIMPMYRTKWSEAKLLPGANRLIKHLRKHGIPFALASNSLREYIEAKISHHEGWKEYFSVILGSDQVKSGKPSPDIYLEAARRLGVDPSNCLVIEDSLVGVKAGKAAQMKVVAVPPKLEADCSSLADSVLHSLLEFLPEKWGLPAFDDWADNALPVEPIYMSVLLCNNGTTTEITDKGRSRLPYQACGLYFGWGKVDACKTLKVVVRIGRDWCPHSGNRIIKLSTIDGDNNQISDQKMQLVLVGYIRKLNTTGKEAASMEEKILEEDISIASASLHLPMFQQQISVYTSNNCHCQCN